jgi:hypothetical protein
MLWDRVERFELVVVEVAKEGTLNGRPIGCA